MILSLCRLYALKEVPLDERSKHRTRDSVVSEAKCVTTELLTDSISTAFFSDFALCFNTSFLLLYDFLFVPCHSK